MLAGKVSSGKSSFINSIIGAFVSCVSLNRETFSPIVYNMSTKGTYKDAWTLTAKLEEKHNSNQKKRETMYSLDTKNLRKEMDKIETEVTNIDKTFDDISLPNLFQKDFMLYDFAGLGDNDDQKNNFGKAIENHLSNMDLVLFVVDATRAFIDKSEVDEFNKIKQLIKKNEDELSIYTDICVIVNKYDDIDDEEVKEIYDKITQKIDCKKIFRWSSHQMFTNKLNKTGIFVPQFMEREFKKILKNGSTNLSTKIVKSTTDNFYDATAFNKCDDSLGDWDNFEAYFDDIYLTIDDKRENVILDCVQKLLNSIPDEKKYSVKKKYYDSEYELKINNTEKTDSIITRIKTKYIQLLNLGRFRAINYDKIVTEYIDKTKNIYAANELIALCDDKDINQGYQYESYIKIMRKKADTLIIEFVNKGHSCDNYDFALLLRPNITKHLEYDKFIEIASYPFLWNSYVSVYKKSCDLGELFPKYKNLVRIAKLKSRELLLLNDANKFNNLMPIFKNRIKLFITIHGTTDEVMHQKLFNDSLISISESNKLEIMNFDL